VKINPFFLTDSYKITHWLQYPPGTQVIRSYASSRGGVFKDVVFCLLQYQLLEYLQGQFVTQHDLDEAAPILHEHFGHDWLNREGWQHIITDHQGKLPVSIRAVREGTVVPTKNVLLTIENTCPRCSWVTNFLETLLVQCWYPWAVATTSRAVKQIILRELELTGDPALIPFKLHDFGCRGVSSMESAMIGGAAHLTQFKGTDTLPAIWMLNKYYAKSCAGHSIPASEHSTITAWGILNEVDAFRNMLDQYPNDLVACVSDSFDIFHACKAYWGQILRDRVLQRNGVLIVRPDSGNPEVTLLEVFRILGEAFGTQLNTKGYKLLDPHVRVIQGDGVNPDAIQSILYALRHAQWSADNLAFGMGGALLQQVNRDTQQVAMKCSQAVIHGVTKDIWKAPVGDPSKHSLRGRLSLVKTAEGFETLSNVNTPQDLLIEVFLNGEIRKRWTFDEVCEQAQL